MKLIDFDNINEQTGPLVQNDIVSQSDNIVGAGLTETALSTVPLSSVNTGKRRRVKIVKRKRVYRNQTGGGKKRSKRRTGSVNVLNAEEEGNNG